jgi:two-component system phosphate regulon sensor histidine kinase PhoR
MREVQSVLRQSQPERGADIVVDIGPDLPPMRGDRAQLSQLLHNLVSNSMKYGQAGTPVTMRLRASRNGALLRLSVSDCGEGIAPEHLPRLTERFYRVDSSRSRAIGGTGLGLSIVKHLVSAMSGEVGVESAVGIGSKFSVKLKLVD